MNIIEKFYDKMDLEARIILEEMSRDYTTKIMKEAEGWMVQKAMSILPKSATREEIAEVTLEIMIEEDKKKSN